MEVDNVHKKSTDSVNGRKLRLYSNNHNLPLWLLQSFNTNWEKIANENKAEKGQMKKDMNLVLPSFYAPYSWHANHLSFAPVTGIESQSQDQDFGH